MSSPAFKVTSAVALACGAAAVSAAGVVLSVLVCSDVEELLHAANNNAADANTKIVFFILN